MAHSGLRLRRGPPLFGAHVSGKKNDGFEDWEADFFSQGEAGELSWEEEAKQAEEAAAKAAAEKAAAEAAAKEAEQSGLESVPMVPTMPHMRTVPFTQPWRAAGARGPPRGTPDHENGSGS